MRVGIVRTDLGDGVYISDVESRVQRNFVLQPPGQSRNVRRPTNTEIESVLNEFAFLSHRGANLAASVNTAVNNTLRIRGPGNGSFYVVTVTAGAATAKTTIRNDLNAAFVADGVPFVASVVGTNQLQIDSISPNSGPSAHLELDTVANGCTLTTAVGFTDGFTANGLSVAALQTAVYPTPTTINVSSATITALSTFASLTTAQKDDLVTAIAEVIAPMFVETGAVLLSFQSGVLSELIQASFRPGGVRAGHAAGIAAAIVENDGVTAFTYP